MISGVQNPGGCLLDQANLRRALRRCWPSLIAYSGLLLSGCGADAPPPAQALPNPTAQEKMQVAPVQPARPRQPNPQVAQVPKKDPLLEQLEQLDAQMDLGTPIDDPSAERMEIAATSAPLISKAEALQIDPEMSRNLEDQNRFLFALLPENTSSENFFVESPGADLSRMVQMPAGFTPLLSYGVNEDGLPWRIRCEKDQSEMVLIPGGQFQMGKEDGPENTRPVHQVYLDPFYIDIYEVTVAQWNFYKEAAREAKARSIQNPARNPLSPSEPVMGVSWGEANLYTRWVRKELPTEAQWERAARGTQAATYPWGEGKPLWEKPRQPMQVDPVGSFRSDCSPAGVFDLAGNAREWCADWYSEKGYTVKPGTENSVLRNPTGPKLQVNGLKRVVRGGDPQWKVYTRSGWESTDRNPEIGFRCALTVEVYAPPPELPPPPPGPNSKVPPRNPPPRGG